MRPSRRKGAGSSRSRPGESVNTSIIGNQSLGGVDSLTQQTGSGGGGGLFLTTARRRSPAGESRAIWPAGVTPSIR